MHLNLFLHLIHIILLLHMKVTHFFLSSGNRIINSLDVKVNSKWISYNLKNANKLFKVREAINVDPFLDLAIENNLPEPFGIVSWNSSIFMSKILDEKCFGDSNYLKDRTVCDLGCGTGLGSFTSALLGAKDIISLDIDQLSLTLCDITFERMKSDHFVNAKSTPTMVFKQFDMNGSEALPFCDVLLMADVTYYKPLAMVAAARVFEAKTKYNANILITDCGRRSTTFFSAELNRLLKNSGYSHPLDCNLTETSEGSFLWL